MFKPMLAGKAEDSKLVFPVLASPKLDGIRACVKNTVDMPGMATVGGPTLLSRSLKVIPNLFVRNVLERPEFVGLDGELIVGEANDPNAMQKTTSGVMSIKGTPDFTYWVFDLTGIEAGFQARYTELVELVQAMHLAWPAADKQAARVARRITDGAPVMPQCPIKLVPHVEIASLDDLLQYEADMLAYGYEGVMTRRLDGKYKHGRSTVNEGWLLKVKRFEDGEAEIIGFEEEMYNGNEATTNELGRTKRSSAKAGKSGKATLGAFIVRDLKTGVEFNVGSGISADLRAIFWSDQKRVLGKLVKYKSFPVGVKEKPRHPVFLGLRDARDMS
jgi:DNA ligase-1